jgi:hypothetical protein
MGQDHDKLHEIGLQAGVIARPVEKYNIDGRIKKWGLRKRHQEKIAVACKTYDIVPVTSSGYSLQQIENFLVIKLLRKSLLDCRRNTKRNMAVFPFHPIRYGSVSISVVATVGVKQLQWTVYNAIEGL